MFLSSYHLRFLLVDFLSKLLCVVILLNTYRINNVLHVVFSASKKQLTVFVSSLRGHVASLLRHMVGSIGILRFPAAASSNNFNF